MQGVGSGFPSQGLGFGLRLHELGFRVQRGGSEIRV